MVESEGIRLLLIDDSPNDLRLYAKLFTAYGCEVTQAKGAEEALALVRHQPFDLVLMDVVMAPIDGIEATRKIRALDIEDMPVIIGFTAFRDEDAYKRCIEAGMDDVFIKPLRWEKFDAVRVAIQAKKTS